MKRIGDNTLLKKEKRKNIESLLEILKLDKSVGGLNFY